MIESARNTGETILAPASMQESRLQICRDLLCRDLVWVLSLALGLRLVFAFLTSETYDYDEFVLLLLARDFAHGAVPYHSFMFFHPPGALLFFRVLEPLTGAWWQAGRVVICCVDTFSAGLVWYIGSKTFGRRAGLLSGLVYSISPLALIAGTRIGQDPIVSALGLAGLAFLLFGRSWPTAVLAGICLGLAITVKLPAVLFVPIYLLAAPRRSLGTFVAAILTVTAVVVPFTGDPHAFFSQVIGFQGTRWSMPIDERVFTMLLFWLAMNPIAVVAVLRLRSPTWLLGGFAAGGLFALASQVYYHYYVPILPFAALLSGGLLATISLPWARILPPLGAALMLIAAAVTDFGGSSPLYVTTAHFSDIQPAVDLVRRHTLPGDSVLADRYEYSYLADRSALAHYFWNVGVLVDDHYLERHLSEASVVILSSGPSSGFPAGFVSYLNARYHSRRAGTATVWLLRNTVVTR
jgi:MFS family permease